MNRSRSLLHGDSGDSRGDLGYAPALHQLNSLLHLHLVIEGNQLGLLRPLPCDQALLDVLLIEAT